MSAPSARADFRRHLLGGVRHPPSPGATAVDDRITYGIPHRVRLEAGYSLVLTVPTGLATVWRDASPTAVVTRSGAQHTSAPSRTQDDRRAPAAPARLVLLRSGRVRGVIPLVAGARVIVPEADGTVGPRFEIVLAEWDLRAGSLVGPGDVGSRLSFFWRRADGGSQTYVPGRPR
jgi:hypothetical protein